MNNDKTIYALASAPGVAGVAVVRVSGPAAFDSLQALTGKKEPKERCAVLVTVKDPVSRETIDKALVLPFKTPNSYTGEDVVEYHLHGGLSVVQSFLKALSTFPTHRMAEPGEFTRRAFEHGKMDLTEAEAVADLIHAETQSQQQQALSQLSGVLSALYMDWADQLTHILAYYETELDFSEDEIPEDLLEQSQDKVKVLIDHIAEHLDDDRRGERLRDGIKVAVIGAPNAGKSSLVNLLAQRDVAIVSDMAGTTRDIIDVHLDLGGYPVLLSDTAGLRPDQLNPAAEAQDHVESEGIRRAIKKAEEADIRLLMFDATELPEMDPHTLELVNENAFVVFNKMDRCNSSLPEMTGTTVMGFSVKEETGLNKLMQALIKKIETMLGSRETPSLTRQRHRDALQECKASLERSLAAPLPELVAEDLRMALRSLGRITGRVDVEDLLDVIFSDFCIGK